MARPSLQNPTARMLVFGTLLATAILLDKVTGASAGTAAAAIAGATATGFLGSVSGEIFGGDVSETLVRRLTGHEELLHNHDLTEAVGKALSIALLAAVDQLDPTPDAVTKQQLTAWAGGIGPHWEALVESEVSVPAGLGEAALPDLFAVAPEAVGTLRALDVESWQALLKALQPQKAPEGMVTVDSHPAIYARLAVLLPTLFPRALREIIKHDAEGNGKAHTGLTLLMLGELVAFAREQKATSGEQAAAFERQCLQWGDSFAKTLDTASQERHKELLAKIGVDVAALKAHLDTRLDALPKAVAEELRTDPRLWARGGRISQVMERNGLFTGRKKELAQLHTTLTQYHKAHLYGLGGMGKTQTALEYAHAFGANYPQGVLWARAENTSVLEEDYRLFAALLGLPQANRPEIAVVCEAVRQELSAHGGYLLVLDNVEDLGTVAPYLPSGGTGHVLITTRISQIVPKETGVRLERLDDEAGADLLLQRAGKSREDTTERPDALKFSATVAGLPLALDQAGAYLAASGGTVASYQELYQQSGAALRKRRGNQAHIRHESVATTYEVAIKKLAEVWPEDSEDEETATIARVAAVEFLRLCAFLAPDDIPDVILKKAGPSLTEPLQKCAADPLVYDATIMRVLKFSMATSRTDSTYVYGSQLFSLHRTVQEVIQDTLSKEEKNQCQHLAITAVVQAHPIDWGIRWDHYSHLANHAKKITELIAQYSIETEHAGTLCIQLGFHEDRQANYAAALPLYERATKIYEIALGADHPDTATSLNNLAALYESQGNYTAALPLYERALGICEAALGANHPDTATSLNNLAELYRTQGNYTAALPLYKRALGIREAALGADHPDTAGSLNNLALLHQSQGNYTAALPLYERALGIREAALGANHPSTAGSLNNLAALHESQGNYAAAFPLYERALGICEAALGADHPDTARSLNNLALLHESQGNYAAAFPLYERALGICEAALGADHPDTAGSLNNLALLHQSQGNYAAAFPLYERALAIREAALGADHPDTARSLNNLAVLYYYMGQKADAVPLLKRAFEILHKSLGRRHPNTQTILQSLLGLLNDIGLWEEALPLLAFVDTTN